MAASNSQYSDGSGTNPSVLASGETVSYAPAVTMIRDVTIRCISLEYNVS
jgi:hypothetical protein